MVININEAIQKIRRAGAANVRIVPMPGHNVLTGDYQIEVRDGDVWQSVVTGLKKKMAEDLVVQAMNRVICG